jgi:hypothetical protein
VSQSNAVSLESLVSEIDQHVARLRAAPAQASGQQALLEIGGTILPLVRDLASYLIVLEGAVARATEEAADRMDGIEQAVDGLGESIAEIGAAEAGGTSFTAEDGARFTEYLSASKLLLEEVIKNPANPKQVRDQIQHMLDEAAALLAIVEESTQGDEEEEDGEEGEESSEEEAE